MNLFVKQTMSACRTDEEGLKSYRRAFEKASLLRLRESEEAIRIEGDELGVME